MTLLNLKPGLGFLGKTILVLSLALVAIFWTTSHVAAAPATYTGGVITSQGTPTVKLDSGAIVAPAGNLSATSLWRYVGHRVKVRGEVANGTITDIEYIVSLSDESAIFGAETVVLAPEENVGGSVETPTVPELTHLEGRLMVRSMRPAIDVSPVQLYAGYSHVMLVGLTDDLLNRFMSKHPDAAVVATGRLDGLTLSVVDLWVGGVLWT